MTRPSPDDKDVIQCYVCMKEHERNVCEMSTVGDVTQ